MSYYYIVREPADGSQNIQKMGWKQFSEVSKKIILKKAKVKKVKARSWQSVLRSYLDQRGIFKNKNIQKAMYRWAFDGLCLLACIIWEVTSDANFWLYVPAMKYCHIFSV